MLSRYAPGAARANRILQRSVGVIDYLPMLRMFETISGYFTPLSKISLTPIKGFNALACFSVCLTLL